MSTFDELIASRKQWIAEVLETWCRAAKIADLRKADDEWTDIAGNVDTESTLWTWAWSRFPDAVEEGFSGINETSEVVVTLIDGTTVAGYPDARAAEKGYLLLMTTDQQTNDSKEERLFCIDEIESIVKRQDTID